MGMMKGMTPRVTVLTLMLPTRATTKSAMPIGGVRMPIIMLSVVITPKKTRSMLNCWAMGMSIGSTRNCSASASINMPRKRSSRLIISSTIKVLSAKVMKPLATCIATRSRAIMSPKKVTVITIRTVTPVIAIASTQQVNSPAGVRSR